MIRLNGNAKVNSHQLATLDFMKAKVNGNMQWENMNVIYCDTIAVNSDKLNIDLTLPNTASEDLSNSLAALEISGANFDAKVSDMIVANLQDYRIDAQISNIMDEKEPMSVFADYSFSRIDAAMDDMVFYTDNPKGTLAMFMKENNDASYIAVYSGDSLSFNMGEDMSFATENLDFNVSANYDDDQEDILLQWNPHAGIKLFKSTIVALCLEIPTLSWKASLQMLTGS